MKIRKLHSELAKRENTKSQARIQAIQSLVGHLSDILWDEEPSGIQETIHELLSNGEKRAKKKKK